MKLSRLFLLSGLLMLAVSAFAQYSYFTYQGRLSESGVSYTGLADMQFTLYDDPIAGNVIAGPLIYDGDPANFPQIDVYDGYFTTKLDFGYSAFYYGSPVYLEISVRTPSTGVYTALTPRSEITPTPYAVTSRFAQEAFASYGFYVPYATSAEVTDTGASVFSITNTATTGSHYAGFFRTESGSSSSAGLRGEGGNIGVWGVSDTGAGLYGSHTGTNGTAAIIGETTSTAANATAITGYVNTTSPGSGAAAVRGINYGTGAAGIGVWGTQNGGGYGVYGTTTSGIGVIGQAFGSSGTTYGVFGTSTSTSGYGGYFVNYTGATALYASGNFAYTGRQNKLDVGENFEAVVRAADFKLGITGRRGTPGRAMVDNGTELVINFARDWSRTVIGSDVLVQGTVRVNVLEIAGADVAEKFPVSKNAKLEPGMVVEIDPENPGHLRLAQGAYNRRVAGVVSGANNLSAGTILGNLPESENGAAVALSGRVWVYCDASERAIEVGDMLTTANKQGHAMSVSDFDKAHGCVIGKAMTALEKGKSGLVLTLINLQ